MKPGDLININLLPYKDFLCMGIYLGIQDNNYVFFECISISPWKTDNRFCFIYIKDVNLRYDLKKIQ